MAKPEGAHQRDVPTPRYHSAELVAAMFAHDRTATTPFDWKKFTPKEVRNTIKGIVYQKAAQHILHDLVTPRGGDSGGIEQMQGFNFIPTTVIDFEPPKTWNFDHLSDLSTNGDPDFVKIQRYVVGLFRDYAGREFDGLERAHPVVAALYDEADRRLHNRRTTNEDRRFTALDLGIEAICGFVNSSFREAEAPHRPPAVQILGSSMLLLISIARESIEGRGSPDSLGVIALQKDPRQQEKTTKVYRSAFMRLSVAEAVRLLSESLNGGGMFTKEAQAEYKSSSLELIRRLTTLTADENISLADLATEHPVINDMLSGYATMEASQFYMLSGTIERLSADFPQLHAAYTAYIESDFECAQKILNPKFFGYSEDIGGFVHKLDENGYSLYWRYGDGYSGRPLGDIVPKDIVTGCSGMMFTVRSEEERENDYWSEFPKIPRNAIGLATTIAYMAARTFIDTAESEAVGEN